MEAFEGSIGRSLIGANGMRQISEVSSWQKFQIDHRTLPTNKFYEEAKAPRDHNPFSLDLWIISLLYRAEHMLHRRRIPKSTGSKKLTRDQDEPVRNRAMIRIHGCGRIPLIPYGSFRLPFEKLFDLFLGRSDQCEMLAFIRPRRMIIFVQSLRHVVPTECARHGV